MFRLLFLCTALLVIQHADRVLAHGTPVIIATPGGKLTVDKALYANLTEDDVIDNAPLPFGPNLQYIVPGFDITGMVATNVLNFELLPQTLTGLPGPQYLSFWSPTTGLSVAPNNQDMRVVSAFGQVTAFQDDIPVPPGLKVTTVTNGVIGVHMHFLNYYLDDYANAADGLYALQFRLKSPQYQSSDPFWIMFDNNITGAEVVAGSNAILAAAVVLTDPSIWQGVNGANWTLAGSWTGSVPHGTTAEAKFTTTGGAMVNLDAAQAVNKLTFDATTGNDFTLSGPGKLALTGATPSISLAASNTGDQTVAVNLDLAAGTTITVNSGSLSLNSPSNSTLDTGVTATVALGAMLNLGGAGNALSDGTTLANVTNNGTLAATTAGKRVGTINGTGSTTVTSASATLTASYIRQAGLNIGTTNTVTVAPNVGNSGVSQVTNLTIGAGGKLDLKENDLVVKSGSLTRAQVETLVNSGALSATGILTTSSTGLTGLGTAQIGDTVYAGSGNYGGLTVTDVDTLVKYTYFGDADLSGAVDFDDYAFIDAGYFGEGNRWSQGDFDNNGVVDFDDYAYIDGSYFGQGAPLLSTGGFNTVPEPSTWVLGSLGLIGLARFWRVLACRPKP